MPKQRQRQGDATGQALEASFIYRRKGGKLPAEGWSVRIWELVDQVLGHLGEQVSGKAAGRVRAHVRIVVEGIAHSTSFIEDHRLAISDQMKKCLEAALDRNANGADFEGSYREKTSSGSLRLEVKFERLPQRPVAVPTADDEPCGVGNESDRSDDSTIADVANVGNNGPGAVTAPPAPAPRGPLSSPSPEQFQAEILARLKGLIPKLLTDVEEKAREVLSLNRALNQTFREALRSEVVPLIEPLLRDIPADYEGKRARAALVNGLLSTFHLAIQITDEAGRTHICSMHPIRARESDDKGSLRLRERTVRGSSSQKSFPIPSPDKIQLINTPHQDQEHDHSPQPSRSGRAG